ncbi:probable bifunctional methylthioribulose-1-phosphate dehydratase/enolase-phosphatase E1 1 isoform X2 [Andrographis paniculata]|uniref:probable bifunctional methylthioribulose-1-phosphate dehydratase/enolase-phosphatase E1 1 isoform X2 n=1 Tax=Andrographis paniculata TaxID=175694 RepID=UPI0021E97130|nr:probable bifunctional methylthioribulose-1-phosphate dehydratase/enolase-phosphatase E1 1 isoform X2 [Andrographis paniculata]
MAAVAAASFAINLPAKMAATSRAIYMGRTRSRVKEEAMAMITAGVHKDRHVLSSLLPSSSECSHCGLFFLKGNYYSYWFDASIKLHTKTSNKVHGDHYNVKASPKTGISTNGIEPSRRCIVLDIEGTTTPISFVTDVLFPYARHNVRKHLELTYDTDETQDDIKLLRSQVQEDLANGVVGAVPIPADGRKEEVIAAIVANVEAMIKADRKITSLKQLQGHIWRTGFQSKEMETIVFDDVPDALEKWHDHGIKVYIYSSGSRLAQRLLFGNTNYGDLRKYLCGFFDTTVGNKKETKSYIEIMESLGVDDPSEILFVTDVYPEATAAKAAGLDVIISIRPGNGALPENHGFRTVNSFAEI